MLTPINEAIAVAGVYKQSRFFPRYFLWKMRRFEVTTITSVSDSKDGAVKKQAYSVVSGQTLYRLEFNRETQDWKLLEVWVE